jgi:hypothetical protein
MTETTLRDPQGSAAGAPDSVVSHHEAAVGGEASFLEGGIAAAHLADAVAAETNVFERPTVFIVASNPPRKCFRAADGLC